MLEELIRSAIGFDEARGDSVTIRSMELPAPLEQAGDANAAPGWATSRPLDIIKLAQVGVTSLVVLVLGLFVVRPILVASATAPALPAPASADQALQASQTGLSGEIQNPSDAISGEISPPESRFIPPTADLDADPVEKLKALIDERQDETVEILRGWIEAPEETA